VSGFNYQKFAILLVLCCLFLMAALFTMVELLLEMIAARNAVADISTVNTTYTEKLVKSFAEGSIHVELAICYSIILLTLALLLVRVAEEMSKT
jgi:hypothetical protein